MFSTDQKTCVWNTRVFLVFLFGWGLGVGWGFFVGFFFLNSQKSTEGQDLVIMGNKRILKQKSNGDVPI